MKTEILEIFWKFWNLMNILNIFEIFEILKFLEIFRNFEIFEILKFFEVWNFLSTEKRFKGQFNSLLKTWRVNRSQGSKKRKNILKYVVT